MKRSDHLFRRGDLWYGWVYELDPTTGRRTQRRRSTGCADRARAVAVLRQWEVESDDPMAAEKRGATLGDAFDNLYAKTTAKAERADPTRSKDTVAFQRKQSKAWTLFAGLVLALPKVKTQHLPKAGMLDKDSRAAFRQSGEGFPLARVDAGFVDEFIAWREGSGVSGSTIGKDLAVLRPAMRYMMRANKWGGSIEKTFPKHELRYKPSERWITVDEFRRLLERGKLEPQRAAVVCFAFAVGAEPRALQRALRADVADPGAKYVHVRGTKRETRDRFVPVITGWQREMLDYVREHADGKDGKLFSRWSNQRRVVGDACVRAGIDSVTITALRHSYAHAMKACGVRQEDLATAMGHRDTKMLDYVYGKATTAKELVERFEHAAAERMVALRVLEGGKAMGKTA